MSDESMLASEVFEHLGKVQRAADDGVSDCHGHSHVCDAVEKTLRLGMKHEQDIGDLHKMQMKLIALNILIFVSVWFNSPTLGQWLIEIFKMFT